LRVRLQVDAIPLLCLLDYTLSLCHIPRSQLPKDQEIKPGMTLVMTLPNQMQLPAKIKEVTAEELTVDINPPLAGQVLSFKITLIDYS